MPTQRILIALDSPVGWSGAGEWRPQNGVDKPMWPRDARAGGYSLMLSVFGPCFPWRGSEGDTLPRAGISTRSGHHQSSLLPIFPPSITAPWRRVAVLLMSCLLPTSCSAPGFYALIGSPVIGLIPVWTRQQPTSVHRYCVTGLLGGGGG